MEPWQMGLGIALLLAVLTFVYLLISKLRRREKVIKILKEAKAMKKEIEKEGLTTASDVVLAQILCGISDVKALILFCVGVLVALNLTIISTSFKFKRNKRGKRGNGAWRGGKRGRANRREGKA